MSRNTVQPNGWAVIRLPNENIRVLQVAPNTTISLGKYGQFPSNLIIERPFHLTYEVQDKRDGEDFSRLRVVPGTELSVDQLVDTTVDSGADSGAEAAEGDDVIVLADGQESTLVDEIRKVVARSNRETIDDSARQTLSEQEIGELKQKGTAAGKELIAKLLLSHTALDEKTAYSLAKYKLLKEKKYIRRFTVLPLDVPLLGQWMLEDRDASKIMEMRQEMLGLVGCWADVHYGGAEVDGLGEPHGGRWLIVDDTGGFLVAAMAERMGILHPGEEKDAEKEAGEENGQPAEKAPTETVDGALEENTANGTTETGQQPTPSSPKAYRHSRKRPHRDDLDDHYAHTNSLTLIHSNQQPNLSLLNYFGFEATDPNPKPPYHPLFTNLLPITWLQLISPNDDAAYAEAAPDVSAEQLAAWKTSRRGNYHRKRRRWARTHQIVDSTRAGGFSGLAVASTMDNISIMRHTLPLLAGGAPVAIYSPTIEPLTRLADCFSIGRRGAWVADPPAEAQGKSAAELERWEGTEEFPLNPNLLLGATVQTSRARRWQVLPGRTHPLMTGRGGADGYVFTGWKAIPAEGRISARGKFQKKRADGA